MDHRTLLRGALALGATALLSAAAHAQLFRAYLDPAGSDIQPCTLQQPCRLLPAALAVVASGGEIWMLDSANYNTAPVNVTKSVTILAIPGALGSVVATGGGSAFAIATAGVKVTLRNLVIVPLPGGGGTNGISMTAGSVLTVEQCVIANLPGAGIAVSTAASVRVTDTTIRDNGAQGIVVQGGAGATVTRSSLSGNLVGALALGSGASAATMLDVADSTVDGNGTGVYAWSQSAAAPLKVSVRDSRVVRASGYGIAAQSDAGAAVTFSASSNMVSNNATGGIGAFGAGTKMWATGNTVSDNGFGLANTGAVFESTTSNAVRNNASGDTSGTITTIAPI